MQYARDINRTFATWAECQKAVSGYSGAEFRGFTEKEEALAFLNMETTGNVSDDKAKEAAGIVEVPENMVIAYVDGSFEKSIGRYAFGCVILTPDGQEIRKSGSGSDSAGVAIRNVAGEMLGSMTAVNWAIENKYPAVEIRYDYEGVEKWVTGVWRAKTPLTSKYAAHMQEAGKKVKISFCKIAAHTGNHYNEEADQLAKSALLKTDEEVRI